MGDPNKYPSNKKVDGPLIVRGRVVDATGAAITDATVRTYRKVLGGTDALLLEATLDADADGFYLLKHLDVEVDALFVRAEKPLGAIVESPVLFGARGDLRVDLVFDGAYKGQTEYAKLKSKIDGLRKTVAYSALSADDIKLLAGQAKALPEHVAYLTAAQLRAADTSPPMEAEALYGLFRKGIPTSSEFLSKNPAVIEAAIASAKKEHIISEAVDAGALISKFDALRKLRMVKLKSGDPTPLQTLLLTVLPDTAAVADFIAKYQDRTGTLEDFWSGLASETGYDADLVADLQFTIQVGAITGNIVPLVEQVQLKRANAAAEVPPRAFNVVDLASWTADDWITEMYAAGLMPPTSYVPPYEDSWPGMAERMVRIVADAFPNEKLAHDIVDQSAAAAAFLLAPTHGPFDIRTTKIVDYFASVTGEDELKEQLETYQRLFRISPTHVKTLAAGEVTSATDIAQMGRTVFKNRFSVLSAEEADAAFDRASFVASTALAVVARHHPSFRSVELPVLRPQPTEAPEGFPSFPSLFGAASYCACDECSSVLGPAAYLADLLHFLKRRAPRHVGEEPTTAAETMLDLLTEATVVDDAVRIRRGDLTRIDLSCENATTPLPYIDLVNEILEFDVVKGMLTDPPSDPPAGPDYARQTTKSADELAWAPEHQLPAAYNTLRHADNVYPWTLPFDLWLEQERAALTHLGIDRADFINALNGGSETIEASVERIGLSPAERSIIAPSGSFVSSAAQWGAAPGTWKADVSNVAEFMSRSGLAFEEIADLRRSTYVNPDVATNPIDVVFDGDPCDIATARLAYHDTLSEPLDAATLGRVFRFVRLRNRIGWTTGELDDALSAIGVSGAVLNDAALAKLGDLQRLRSLTGRSVHDVLTLAYGSVSTRSWGEAPSQFDAIYSRPGATVVVDPAGDIIVQLTAIVAALGIDAAEVRLLVGSSPTYATLANLSSLYQRVTLARTLRFTIRELIRFVDVSGTAIPTTPGTALSFIANVFADRRHGIGPAELDFLVADHVVAGERVASDDTAIAATLLTLHQRLAALPAGTALVESVTDDALRRNLEAIFDTQSLVTRMASIIDAPSGWTPDDASFVTMWMRRVFGSALSEAQAKLTASGALTAVDERRRYVLGYVIPYIARMRTVSDVLTALFPKSAEAARFTLGGVQVVSSGAVQTLADRFSFADDWIPSALVTDDFTVQSLPTRASVPDAFEAIAQLEKCVLVASKLHLRPSEFDAFFHHHVPGFYHPADPANRTYAKYVTLRDAVEARDRSFGEQVYFDLMDQALNNPSMTTSDLKASIVARTGWVAADLDTVLAEHLSLAVADFATSDLYIELTKKFAAAQPFAIGPADLRQILALDDTIDDYAQLRADVITRAVRGAHGADGWIEFAKSIADRMRQRQRDALVSFLVARDGLSGPDDLFARLLIDTQMEPCQSTSRIKAAIGSVQSFVQRALLQLEPNAHLDETDAAEWSWMKSYRVWEANRQVFLYPENWLEPELRDNKTPFFQDFEHALRQNEARADVVEDAFVDYAHALQHVARMQLAGCCRDEDGTFHVFARTLSTPYAYFYRSYSRATGWTGWEKVSLDIEGEQLCPVVFNGRLYVFWLVVSQRGKDNAAPTDATVPTMEWSVRVAWSMRKNGKWIGKSLSDDLQPLLAKEAIDSRQYLFLRTSEDGGDLVIGVWNRIGGDATASAYRQLLQYRLIDGVGPLKCSRDLFFWPANSIVLPSETYAHGFGAKQGTQPAPLYLQFVDPADPGAVGSDIVLATAFGGPMELVIPPQLMHYVGDSPIFVQDGVHVFYVEPTTVLDDENTRDSIRTPDRAQLERVERTNTQYRSNSIRSLANDPFRFSLGDSVYGTATIEASGDPFVLGIRANTDDASDTGIHAVQTELAVAYGVDGASTPASDTSYSTTLVTGSDIGIHADDIHSETALDGLVVPHVSRLGYRFSSFEHPYVTNIVRALNRYGVRGLFAPVDATLNRQAGTEEFFSHYGPTALVVDAPAKEFDFRTNGAYATYNWELFFHAPFLVAEKLRANRQYEEALRWLRFIFDPMDASGGDPQRAWKFRPFYEEAGPAPIDQLMKLLDYDVGTDAERRRERDRLELEIEVMRNSPFHPHAIARLRPEAYQKATVMKMLDVLIEWGDGLFALDTIESITEATQIYLLAAAILGRKPTEIDHRDVDPVSFDGLSLDDFSNAVVSAESVLREPSRAAGNTTAGSDVVHPIVGPSLYFCVPPNPKLLGYWDTVADRLFKIRHCQNLAGIVRQLPLFEPPIDPALLVRAAAAGVDIRAALSDINAPLPIYRFSVLAQRAMELSNEVRALGGALLAALEKKDAETIALLRSGHEVTMQSRIAEVRQQQVDEASASLDALRTSRTLAEEREAYYRRLIANPLNENEQAQLTKMQESFGFHIAAQALGITANFIALVPEFDAGISGAGGSPVAKARFGGSNLAQALQAFSGMVEMDASIASHIGAVAGLQGGYDRRATEWRFQADQAAREQTQLDKQIIGAEIRLQIAEHELENQRTQLANSTQVDELLHSKFTNEELYDWMIRQITSVYNEAYQLAYNLAKKAQRAYEHEIGPGSDPSFIRFGYWTEARKGLLAGDLLVHDLQRMQTAYLEANVREHEMVKHISIAQLDPLALASLKETGSCSVNIPEVLFDLDQPGHYFRRIKSVAATVPCVTGPYTGVHCKLSLGPSRIRTSTTIGSGYAETGTSDPRFKYLAGNTDSVVTSSGQSDSGLFEANLRDERYLPFEGAGAIGTWDLSLPVDLPQFDYDSITDVVITMRYTARYGGDSFADTVGGSVAARLDDLVSTVASTEGLMRAFSMRQEFPSAWHRFLYEPVSSSNHLEIDIAAKHFPFAVRHRLDQFVDARVIVVLADGVEGDTIAATLTQADATEPATLTLAENESFGSALADDGAPPDAELLGTWCVDVAYADGPTSLRVVTTDVPPPNRALDPLKIKDLILVLHYTITAG